MTPRTPVVIESPFTGITPDEIERNQRYLKIAMLDSLSKGEAPFASHALYTLFLDDDIKEQRMIGINAGLAWQGLTERVCVYTDLGISPGMAKGIENALMFGKTVEPRSIVAWMELDGFNIDGTFIKV